MTEQLTVLYVVDDTVVEETFTAERITLQHFPGGRLQVMFWADRRVARYVFYRQFERTDHVIDQAPVPREELSVSFVRMGSDGSQVYIYDDVDRGPVCCFCAFTRSGGSFAADFATRDLEEMLAHVTRHREAGHVVPAWVDDVLRAEWHRI